MSEDDFNEIEDFEEELEGEISQLINKSLLEGSGGELACPNCENVCEIFCHIYDEDKCGLSCSNCRYEEWVSEGGSGPRVCQVCDEYVTEEDEKKDNVVTCSAVDPEGRSTCDQYAHKDCADYCSDCGYFCENESNEYIECRSCGLKHDSSHFVSFGSDFIDEFGLICESCFYDNEEDYEITKELPHWEVGTAEEDGSDLEEETFKEVEGEKILIPSLASVPHFSLLISEQDRKRSD